MNFDIKILGVRFLIVDVFKLKQHINDKESCDNVKCEIVSKSNVKDILEWKNENYYVVFRNFLEQNNIGVYSYYKNVIVGRAWGVINFSIYAKKMYGKRILLPKAVRIEFVEVRERYRGNGIANILLSYLIKKIVSYNYGDIYIDISSKNIPMQRIVKYLGFEKKFSFFVIQIRSKNVVHFILTRK